MQTDYIALSIPGFFALIGLELAAARVQKVRLYRLSDAIANLGCGVFQQVSAVFFRVALVGGYEYVYRRHRWFEWPESDVLGWVVLFLGVDFCYYWFHRASHEVNLLWAAHVVHHQSEDLNLAVALRQAVFQPLLSWVFYLPLALVGFSAVMFGTVLALSTLYQFWIHTRLVGRLGPLEWFLNTPSHHRVHHGRNPRYIDKNHGAVLIIWDRLFGTFQVEDEEVVYGITEPLGSFNPVFANFHYFGSLLEDARSAERLRDRARVWFMRPGWRPSSRIPLRDRTVPLDAPRYDPPASNTIAVYVLAHFVPVVLATMHLLKIKDVADTASLAALGVAIVISVMNLAGLLEGKRWIFFAEAGRLAFAVAATVSLLPAGAIDPVWAALISAFSVVSFVGLVRAWPRPSP